MSPKSKNSPSTVSRSFLPVFPHEFVCCSDRSASPSMMAVASISSDRPGFGYPSETAINAIPTRPALEAALANCERR